MTTFWKGFRHSTIQRFVHSICSQSSYVRTEKWRYKVKSPSKHDIEFNEFAFYEEDSGNTPIAPIETMSAAFGI